MMLCCMLQTYIHNEQNIWRTEAEKWNVKSFLLAADASPDISSPSIALSHFLFCVHGFPQTQIILCFVNSQTQNIFIP